METVSIVSIIPIRSTESALGNTRPSKEIDRDSSAAAAHVLTEYRSIKVHVECKNNTTTNHPFIIRPWNHELHRTHRNQDKRLLGSFLCVLCVRWLTNRIDTSVESPRGSSATYVVRSLRFVHHDTKSPDVRAVLSNRAFPKANQGQPKAFRLCRNSPEQSPLASLLLCLHEILRLKIGIGQC